MSRHLIKATQESDEIRNALYAYSEQFLRRTEDSKLSLHADTKFIFDSLHLLYKFLTYYRNKDEQSALAVRDDCVAFKLN
jgi:hypothetical protein